MNQDNRGIISEEALSKLTSECERTNELAKNGADFLLQCGSQHGTHDMSVTELSEIGRKANLEALVASPQLLKWWNIIRK